MMNRNASLRLAYGLFALCLICTTALADDAPRNIVLIGWDGCQRNHLKEMIASNEAPNLMALAKDGKFVDIDITTGATDTKAGWTQILTGYAPEKTGVYNNGRYQSIPEGYTVFERLEAFFGPTNMDIAPTILKRFGMDVSTCRPSLDGIPLDDPAPERRAPVERPSGMRKKNPAKTQAATENAAAP